MKGAHWAAFVALLFCVSSVTLAQSSPPPVPVHVKANESGQGWLFQRLNTCYALTADHVLRGGDRATLIGGMKGFVTGRALLLRRFIENDLALLRVTGPLADHCGIELSGAAALESFVNTRARGELIEVLGDGSIKRVAVRVDDVGPVYLRIQGLSSADALYQGQSGGLVTVADSPAGMLLTIEDQVAKTLRYDTIEMLLDQYFKSPALDPASKAAPSQKLAASSGNLLSAETLAHANVLPLTPDAGPENLVTANRPPWLGDLASLRDEWVEIDITLRQVHVISSLELLSATVAPMTRRIRDYEVLASTSPRAGWFSLRNGTCFAEDDVCRIDLSPTRAQTIKLRIHSNWGARDAVGLSAVRAYATAPR